MIKFEGFSCYYKIKKGYLVALDKISLHINDGERIAIVGESGSGKTTFLKCILGLPRYTDGKLTIDGKDVSDYDKRKNALAYVSQEYVLYTHLNVYENIAYPLRSMRMPYDEADQLVKNIAKTFKLRRLLTRMPRQLSGGQQQCVAIARALVKSPKLVLFDEPLSNLDSVKRNVLRQLLLDYCKENNCTAIYVTHDVEDAAFFAERIVEISEGEIVKVYTSEEYLKSQAEENRLAAEQLQQSFADEKTANEEA